MPDLTMVIVFDIQRNGWFQILKKQNLILLLMYLMI
jgi:hypothetical protein